jgi:dihydropteroate synthase
MYSGSEWLVPKTGIPFLFDQSRVRIELSILGSRATKNRFASARVHTHSTRAQCGVHRTRVHCVLNLVLEYTVYPLDTLVCTHSVDS